MSAIPWVIAITDSTVASGDPGVTGLTPTFTAYKRLSDLSNVTPPQIASLLPLGLANFGATKPVYFSEQPALNWPSLTSLDMNGPYTGTPVNNVSYQGPTGGEGGNHPASAALSKLIKTVIDADNFSPPVLSISGTTASLGGSALLAGACSSTTVSLPGATTSMALDVTPQTYPGDGNYWNGYVSSAGVATIKICASVAATPTASLYNVRAYVP